MRSVEAVPCDMNSDFQEAFEEKCPWIQPVFDYFHIVKNFNYKVVSEVRKDEQRRLYEEGLVEEAAALKKPRYILISNRSTFQAKDAQARTGGTITRSGSIFPMEAYVQKEGYEAKYDELLIQNRMLFTHHSPCNSQNFLRQDRGCINNKIKTPRRQGYGYPDDDYFFLKLFNLSRAEVVRNPKSHRKSD